jgi:hypothetical protein
MFRFEKQQVNNRDRHNELWRHNRNLINLEQVHHVYSVAECIESRGMHYRFLKKRKKKCRN